MEKNYIYIGILIIGLTLLLQQFALISHFTVGIGLGMGIALEVFGVYKMKRSSAN